MWRWDLGSEAFGESEPEQDPDGDDTLFVLDLRYPGQQYDSATGFNYNYFRDYDPSVGRYVQSDPIGLAGGVSTFAYAFSDPLQYIDPRGLTATAEPLWEWPDLDLVRIGASFSRLANVAGVCLSLTGDKPKRNCRARIQAQGDGYEDSVAWSFTSPATPQWGLEALNTLAMRMPARELKKRAIALEKHGCGYRRQQQLVALLLARVRRS